MKRDNLTLEKINRKLWKRLLLASILFTNEFVFGKLDSISLNNSFFTNGKSRFILLASLLAFLSATLIGNLWEKKLLNKYKSVKEEVFFSNEGTNVIIRILGGIALYTAVIDSFTNFGKFLFLTLITSSYALFRGRRKGEEFLSNGNLATLYGVSTAIFLSKRPIIWITKESWIKEIFVAMKEKVNEGIEGSENKDGVFSLLKMINEWMRETFFGKTGLLALETLKKAPFIALVIYFSRNLINEEVNRSREFWTNLSKIQERVTALKFLLREQRTNKGSEFKNQVCYQAFLLLPNFAKKEYVEEKEFSINNLEIVERKTKEIGERKKIKQEEINFLTNKLFNEVNSKEEVNEV